MIRLIPWYEQITMEILPGFVLSIRIRLEGGRNSIPNDYNS